MTEKNTLPTEEQKKLMEETLNAAQCECDCCKKAAETPKEEIDYAAIDPDDDFADFRNLSEEEQKWALLQMQLDSEERYMVNTYTPE